MVYMFMTHIGKFPNYPLGAQISFKSSQQLLNNLFPRNVFFQTWFTALPNRDKSSLSQPLLILQL